MPIGLCRCAFDDLARVWRYEGFIFRTALNAKAAAYAIPIKDRAGPHTHVAKRSFPTILGQEATIPKRQHHDTPNDAAPPGGPPRPHYARRFQIKVTNELLQGMHNIDVINMEAGTIAYAGKADARTQTDYFSTQHHTVAIRVHGKTARICVSSLAKVPSASTTVANDNTDSRINLIRMMAYECAVGNIPIVFTTHPTDITHTEGRMTPTIKPGGKPISYFTNSNCAIPALFGGSSDFTISDCRSQLPLADGAGNGDRASTAHWSRSHLLITTDQDITATPTHRVESIHIRRRLCARKLAAQLEGGMHFFQEPITNTLEAYSGADVNIQPGPSRHQTTRDFQLNTIPHIPFEVEGKLCYATDFSVMDAASYVFHHFFPCQSKQLWSSDTRPVAMGFRRKELPHPPTIFRHRHKVGKRCLVNARTFSFLHCRSPLCHALSPAGTRLGLEDPRMLLYQNAIDPIRAAKPNMAILENSSIMATFNDRRFAKDIDAQLSAAGYNFFALVVKTLTHGLPQNRKRYYVVAIK